MAEGGFDLNEIFRLDVTDDLAELDMLDTEIDEDNLEEPDSNFKNVSKGEFVAVLTRIRDRDCNILDEAIFAEKLLTNIEEKEGNILPFLTIVETSFSSFINVKVKAKQVRSIRIEQNFLKDSTERIQIQQKWGELVESCGICTNKNISKTVLEHVLLHFWIVKPHFTSDQVTDITLNTTNSNTSYTTDKSELEAISYHGGWAVKRSRDLIKSKCDASSHIVLKQSVSDSNNVFVDPKKALELIETLGTDEKRGDKYLFVLHPEVTNFFVLLHDFTDSYFSVSSFDDQVIINCLKNISINVKLRLAWETICKNAFPLAVQISVLQRISTMFLKSKQQIIREKLNLKPQKGSVALRQDIRKPKKKKSKQTEIPSSISGNQTPDVIVRLQKDFENPEIVAECLREIGLTVDPQFYLNHLTGKQLTKLLKRLGKPALNGKGKAKQIAVLLPVIVDDTQLNIMLSKK